MKVTYTESGKSELERFQRDRKEQLESLVKKNKYVFGDEEIEITASDIKNAENAFRYADFRKYRLSTMNLVFKVYTIIGVLLVAIGIFYEQFKEIFLGSPLQLALVMGGIALVLFSMIGSYYLRLRSERIKDLLERNEALRSDDNASDK